MITAAYEREKSVNKGLERQLKVALSESNILVLADGVEKEIMTSVRCKNGKEIKIQPSMSISSVSENKSLKDKLALMTRKLDEERISNQKLKSNMLLLNKYIIQEVGQDPATLKVLFNL